MPLVASTAFGVYIHIPFCHRRCDYCAFATWTDRHHLADTYADALITDIRRSYAADDLPPATSVFVGGGTPTQMAPDTLMQIVAAIPLTAGAEVTVECNPDDVTPEMMQRYVAGGVNRISLGVQSMVPSVLASLGRWHDPAAVTSAVAAIVSAGVPTYNLDLIYGVAGETDADWAVTLGAALALQPAHISAYALTVEPGTPLADDPTRHPDDDVQADRYLMADDAFLAVGLENYEISNWARPGHECRHNLLYWEQGNYLGVGSAAHSHADGRRWWRVRTPERYIQLVAAGESTEAAGETLDAPTRRFEKLELSLRTRSGVPASALKEDELEGLVERAGDRLTLTRRGRLLANQIALRLDTDAC